MLCGGEALPRTLADQLLAGEGELWNMYGPTETTIWSAVSRVCPSTEAVPIGPPIANTQFYVVDVTGQLSPFGVPGELWIGGDGVAEGYFKRPQLTADRFAADPFRQNSRVYKTGDLVRRLPDGMLEFLGRLDYQVKLRGYRIELGEIETVLAAHPEIAEAVVVALESKDTKRLVAYYTAVNGHGPENQELKDFVNEKLPSYMAPAVFVRLDALPRTPNGKVNRKVLPAPDLNAIREKLPQRPPTTPLELNLAEICKEVLQLDNIGVDDNLFELGADSIQIFRIVARANRSGLALTAPQLLQKPSIAGVASTLSAVGESSTRPNRSPILAIPRQSRTVLSNSRVPERSA
jgi:aryl carrier-like protein